MRGLQGNRDDEDRLTRRRMSTHSGFLSTESLYFVFAAQEMVNTRVERKIPFILTKHTFEWTKKNGHDFISLWNSPADLAPTALVSAAGSRVTRRSSRSFSECVKAPKMLLSARQHQSLQAVLPSEMECWCIPLFKVRPGVKGQPCEEHH